MIQVYSGLFKFTRSLFSPEPKSLKAVKFAKNKVFDPLDSEKNLTNILECLDCTVSAMEPQNSLSLDSISVLSENTWTKLLWQSFGFSKLNSENWRYIWNCKRHILDNIHASYHCIFIRLHRNQTEWTIIFAIWEEKSIGYLYAQLIAVFI